MDSYTNWLLRANGPVFEMNGTLWRPYRQGLVSASLKPAPVQLSRRQEKDLLKTSGSLFLRYFTRTSTEPTGFWYTICSEYDPARRAKSELRRRIKRGHEHCAVRKLDAAWLAVNGYACYAAAFARYGNTKPDSQTSFQAGCLNSAAGPFEFWGVFVADKLVGFAKCAVADDYVGVLVSKLDPQYLNLFSSYALRDAILQEYVAKQRKVVGDGFRSIAHKTEMHEFLLKFGYQRVYCDLRVVYQPLMRAVVDLAYPLRVLLDRLPSIAPVASVQVLLAQEQIRRSFA